MKNILTKLLTSLAFAGVVAVPLMTSSVYGAGNTPANSQKKASMTNNNDVQLLAQATGQDTRLCKYDENVDLRDKEYIDSCMKPGTLNQIPENVRTSPTLHWLRQYATNPNSIRNETAKRLAPDCKKAYPILTNPSNLRPPKDWTFSRDEEYRKEKGLGEYSPNL